MDRDIGQAIPQEEPISPRDALRPVVWVLLGSTVVSVLISLGLWWLGGAWALGVGWGLILWSLVVIVGVSCRGDIR